MLKGNGKWIWRFFKNNDKKKTIEKMNVFDITFLTGEALVSCNLDVLTVLNGFGNDELIIPLRIAWTSAAVDDEFVSAVKLVDMGNPFDCGPVTSAKPRTCSN